MKKRILVVDDEVIIADDLCNTLNNLGYEALDPALSYKGAIEVLGNEQIDLAILDINLGGKKTGIDVAEFIQEHLNIPFIFLSSHTDTKTLELAKNTMPYAYLVKPYGASDVMTAIEIAFNNQKRYSENKATTDSAHIPNLTAMEKVVIRKISENLSTKEIAEQLFISESTVKNHRHNICVKLDLPAGTHSLLKWVMENNQYIQ
ncbi:response regulator [Roseivirga echinicomitans]